MSYVTYTIIDDADVPNPTTGKVRLYSSSNHSFGNVCSKDENGNIIVYSPGITGEQVQDIMGATFASSASITPTYDDVANLQYFAVNPAGVDHDALLNFVVNKHIDHSAVSITAGAGLTGGGNLTATRSIAMPNVGTAGSYGSAAQVAAFSTDAQGRVTSVTNTAINGVPGANITNTPAGGISATTVQAALNELDSEKVNVALIGAASGICPLGVDSKVPALYLPSYVDDVLEFANLAAFPGTGENAKIYVALDSNKTYRWSGSAYIEISPSAVTSVFGRSGAVVAQSGDYSAAQITNTPSGNISAITVQAALNELDSEKVPTTRTVSAGAGLSGGGDLSANITFSMPNIGTPNTYGSATQIPVLTTDAQGRVSAVTNTAIAIPAAQVTDFTAAARAALSISDTTSIDLSYNSGTGVFSGVVLPAGVNHDALLNYSANRHIDHSAVSISAGAGLTGGGDLTTNRSLALTTTGVTASSYGSASQVSTFSVDTYGRVTAASSVAIAIPASQVTDFSEAVDDRVAALIVQGAGISVSYNDPSNTLTIASTITQYTDEQAQDAVASILQNGTGLSWAYNDALNTLVASVSLSPFTTANLSEGTNLYYTDARARASHSATDSSSIDFTYTPATGVLTGVVLPAGVNHDALQNFVANEHVDHSAVSISAGAGLTGGGDLTANRSISMPNVGTPNTYGDATSYPIITTDAQGRVTAVSIQAVPGGQITASTSAAVTNNSNVTNVALNELSITLVANTTYEINVTLVFRSANTNTGISMAYGAGTAVISSIAGYNETSTNTTTVGRLPFVSATTNSTFASSAVTNQDQIMNARIILTTGGTGGTFIPQFRSEKNGTLITVQANSRITAEVV